MRRFFSFLILIGLLGAAYVYAQGKDVSLAEESQNLTQEKVEEVRDSANKELTEFSERAKNVGEQTKKVLGAAVQPVEENEQSIQEKAIEYGQYLYCKQVVETHETKEDQ